MALTWEDPLEEVFSQRCLPRDAAMHEALPVGRVERVGDFRRKALDPAVPLESHV